MIYTAEIHAMSAAQVWQSWKNQQLTVYQVETWQRKHNYYFQEEKHYDRS
jgi:hypothetical protein